MSIGVGHCATLVPAGTADSQCCRTGGVAFIGNDAVGAVDKTGLVPPNSRILRVRTRAGVLGERDQGRGRTILQPAREEGELGGQANSKLRGTGRALHQVHRGGPAVFRSYINGSYSPIFAAFFRAGANDYASFATLLGADQPTSVEPTTH